MDRQKLLIIGLDCATPSLFFDRHLSNIPTIKRLQASGIRGRMESSDPPITIPAWMCMATGKTPGMLGVYGFRHLKKGTYDQAWIASSSSIQASTAWEILGEHDIQSIIVGIPPTYPVRPFEGNLVSCFITPSAENEFTNPPSLKQEILDKFGHYTFDVSFRIEEKKELFENLLAMTRERHEVLKYLLETKPWDLCWFVEIGLDRMHHSFWKFFDEHHKDYQPSNEYREYINEYENLLDDNVKELIELVPDNTKIFVVSDHGAQPMDGCVCVNEWLIQEGYLVLNEYPGQVTQPEKLDIDWSKTKAIGWGGYYARIFFNVIGREPQGIIDPENYTDEREALRRKIEMMVGPSGELLGNKTFTSEDLYPDGFIGDDPDLFVYFGDLSWRSAGTVGHQSLFLEENDTGPDDAVHAKQGLFIGSTKSDYLKIADSSDAAIDENLKAKKIQQFSIYDVFPTIMKHFDLPMPKNGRGKPIPLKY
ncbi:MAG TPA: alkaline phosphatase family protein [Candidatus Lokiarchaeia archaeon]|nr:alkaline phosphatase family protein [Candidatus Lokiarchaeia archaeon]